MAWLEGKITSAQPKWCIVKASFQKLGSQGWRWHESSPFFGRDKLFNVFLFTTGEHPPKEPADVRECQEIYDWPSAWTIRWRQQHQGESELRATSPQEMLIWPNLPSPWGISVEGETNLMIFMLSTIRVDGIVAIFRLNDYPPLLTRSDQTVGRVFIGTDKTPVLRNLLIECTS